MIRWISDKIDHSEIDVFHTFKKKRLYDFECKNERLYALALRKFCMHCSFVEKEFQNKMERTKAESKFFIFKIVFFRMFTVHTLNLKSESSSWASQMLQTILRNLTANSRFCMHQLSRFLTASVKRQVLNIAL